MRVFYERELGRGIAMKTKIGRCVTGGCVSSIQSLLSISLQQRNFKCNFYNNQLYSTYSIQNRSSSDAASCSYTAFHIDVIFAEEDKSGWRQPCKALCDWFLHSTGCASRLWRCSWALSTYMRSRFKQWSLANNTDLCIEFSSPFTFYPWTNINETTK